MLKLRKKGIIVEALLFGEGNE